MVKIFFSSTSHGAQPIRHASSSPSRPRAGWATCEDLPRPTNRGAGPPQEGEWAAPHQLVRLGGVENLGVSKVWVCRTSGCVENPTHPPRPSYIAPRTHARKPPPWPALGGARAWPGPLAVNMMSSVGSMVVRPPGVLPHRPGYIYPSPWPSTHHPPSAGPPPQDAPVCAAWAVRPPAGVARTGLRRTLWSSGPRPPPLGTRTNWSV